MDDEDGIYTSKRSKALQSLGYYRKAIECHEKDLKIASKITDQSGEGRADKSLDTAYQSLDDYQKAIIIEYHEKKLNIAK